MDGAASAPGQPNLIDNLPFTVVGVAPAEFFGVDPAAAPDVYLPMRTLELLGAANQPCGLPIGAARRPWRSSTRRLPRPIPAT